MMNSEEKYWLCIWSLVACTLSLIVLCVTVTAIYNSRTVKDMVSVGVDPVKAHCAVYGTYHNEAFCTIAALEQKK